MRCRELIRDLSGLPFQVRFGSFSALLFPIADFKLNLFKMRRPRVDFLQHFRSSSGRSQRQAVSRYRVSCAPGFQTCLLVAQLPVLPTARRLASNRFDSPNSGGDRFFLYDSKWPDSLVDLTCVPPHSSME
jgi:hypothetical protein